MILSGCGGGGGGSSAPPSVAPTATPLAGDDWTTFAHDQARTGYQPQSLSITPANVATLQVRWQTALGERILASPIVAAGNVFIATDAGTLAALDIGSGALKWRVNLGYGIRATPMLAGTTLYVGIYGDGSNFTPVGGALAALDSRTGTILWRTALPGLIRSDPVLVGNTIYEGIAGGDFFNGCTPGRVVTLDATSGALLSNVWYTAGTAPDGGGIWAPFSTDGQRLFFTTGNSCDGKGLQNSIVSTSFDLQTTLWSDSANGLSGIDLDVGSGVTLMGSNAYALGKTGTLYALDKTSGAVRWSYTFATGNTAYGPIATVTSNGTIVTAQSAGLGTGASNGVLAAFDLSGNLKWSIPATSRQVGAYVAFASGLAFVTMDQQVLALDPASGRTLWSFTAPALFYGAPAIVPSGLYVADTAGNVFAFSTR